MLASTFLLSLMLLRPSIAGYVLEDAYNPSNFFDMFDFFDGPDPTAGFVKLVNRQTAQSSGLITTAPDSVQFGVDATAITPDGRSSIRIESKKSYNQGLIIADIAHMPGSICGTWPAFWTTGPDWPANGEIDIIEGVNSQKFNSMTLHTEPGCSIQSSKGRFTGSVKTQNCDTQASGQGTNVGCGIGVTDPTTYGDGFNGAGGGVYATEWTASAIIIHHFERANIPADIQSGNPDPSTWGTPLAVFSGCNFPQVIRNQSIVFDTTFCGQWAGQQSVWQADAVCSKKAATCQQYVQNNPADFANAFWKVNSVKVYQQGDGFIASTPVALPPAASTSKVISSTINDAIPTTLSNTTKPMSVATSIRASRPMSSSASSLIAAISSAPSLAESVTIVTTSMTTTMTLNNMNIAPAQQTVSPTAPVKKDSLCQLPHHDHDGCISKGKSDALREGLGKTSPPRQGQPLDSSFFASKSQNTDGSTSPSAHQRRGHGPLKRRHVHGHAHGHA